MKKLILSVFLIIPMILFAGDPIPGIDITVNQSPGGISKGSKTNNNGEAIFTGLKDGDYTITIRNNNKTVVIGKSRNDKITISSTKSANIKPIRLELSSYSGGEDLLLRKRPGRAAADDHSGGLSTGKRQHKTANASGGSGGTSTQSKATSHNASRSNRSSGISDTNDDDCDDGEVEIRPMANGKLVVKITCGK